MGTRIKLFVALCIIWLGLTGSFAYSSVIIAAPISGLIVFLTDKLLININYSKIMWKKVLSYASYLAKEVLTSSWKVSNIAWRKNLLLDSQIEQIKTTQDSDLGLVIYANSITITPGTVTIANQGNDLLVHALDVSFMDDLKQGQMEENIKKIIRPN